MSAVAIAEIISALAQAIPELAALFTQSTVSSGDVDTILSKYGIDQMALTAAIAAAKIKGK
jgi:hypothetical protein